MKILLSVKPIFVKEIIKGRKLFEYRKTIYKNRNVNKIVVYSSSPVCRIVGEFCVEEILCEAPKILWKKTGTKSGVSKEYFDKYFEGRAIGYAIRIKSFHSYSNPKLLKDTYPGITPPQSFRYVKDEDPQKEK
ncbi:hypothetical protein [Hallella colorans]|jgi:hypothetical protein|uniref:hypothetical protein n=1 Tax=Hallella colorans TaxID=1703337 RepID=UPI0023F2FD76|nr:hypothetical protein [Hallella colorans]